MEIRPATADDAADCVDILSTWIEETPWMPRLHSDASMRNFWGGRLADANGWVAVDAGRVCGFCVRDAGWVSALYLGADARRRGIGTRLLNQAKAGQSHLRLWVFQANETARAFYLRQGFKEERRTTGDNEEGLPDIAMLWSRGP